MNKVELTIGIATCGRPRVLKRCIRSIDKFTKTPHKFIVLDNIKAFTNKREAQLTNLPKGVKLIEVTDRKIGCCESNNILEDACNTPYFMHIDDDVYLDKEGLIDILFNKLKDLEGRFNHKVPMVGGAWGDTFYGQERHCTMKYIYGETNGVYYVKKLPIPYNFSRDFNIDWIPTDELLHSYIVNIVDARANKFRWDNHFQWKGDRLDYFHSIKDKAMMLQYNGDVFIHDPQPFRYGSISYEDFKGAEAKEYFLNKWGIVPLVGWDKEQLKPK